jgi:crossover junction endodeoxyribonuclease RuvC
LSKIRLKKVNILTKYRIMGIDPGTNVLGYAIVEVFQKQVTLIDIGVVKMGHTPEHSYKLKMIFEKIQEIIVLHQPNELAIESPFYGKNPQSMLKLGRAQGVAMASAMMKGLFVTEYSPKKIKQSITGNGNASKEQVAAMLCTILKQDVMSTYLDATDALAAAVCHFFQSSTKVVGQKSYSGWGAFVKENPDKLKK